MWFYLFVALAVAAYIYFNHLYSFWERHGVKGPKPIWVFGNSFKALTFQEHPNASQIKWYNTYSDSPYVGFYKLMTPSIMVRDPDLVKDILVKAFPSFHSNDVTIAADDDMELINTNPFVQVGERWKRNRAIFGQMFSPNKVRGVFPKMIQVGEEWEKYVRSFGAGKELDAKFICCRYTTETMLRCTFGINGKSFAETSEFIEMGQSIFNPDPLTALRGMCFFLVPVLGRILKLSLTPPKVEQRIIQFVKEQILARESGAVQSEDMLQVIMSLRDKYNITDHDIAGICFSFLIESYETSSNAMMLALLELASHPEIQDELSRTIQESIENNNGEITYDLVAKHEYLEKVLFETMRRRTTFFGLQKKCTKPYTLPLCPGQTKPVTIPAGTSVLIPFSSFNQDPNIYPNPDVFDPERFSPEEKALRHKHAFIPFGDGPRMCIGMVLGLFNLKMGLFQIIRYFDVKLGPSQKPFVLQPLSFFNIPKDGVKLIFTPRNVK